LSFAVGVAFHVVNSIKSRHRTAAARLNGRSHDSSRAFFHRSLPSVRLMPISTHCVGQLPVNNCDV